METLERKAREEWGDMLVGQLMHEYVALGIVEPSGRADTEGTIVWFELENVADAESRGDGRGEFLVEGPELMRVCRAAAEELGYLTLGQDVRARVDAMLRERVVVIWHTHTATTDPSREDIDEFPEWLADYGMVYHVPSGTTTVYNKSGIISSTKSPVEVALATPKE